MPFKSKQQEKWAFATGQKFAHKWAHLSGQHHGKPGSKAAYRRLPAKVKKPKKRGRR